MCEFFSPIVTRDLKIIHCADIEDSHERVIEKYKLKDDKLENRDFVRLELTSKDENIFNHKIENWDYKEDETDTLPQWYKDNIEEIKKKTYKELLKVFKKQFLIDKTVDVLDTNIRFMNNCKVNILKSQVGEMCGNSQVGGMYDNSQVDKIWGNSQVGEMWGSSQVGEMCDSNTINIWSKDCKIKKREGGKTVVIKRYLKKIKVDIK